jgi:hypothetical protein
MPVKIKLRKTKATLSGAISTMRVASTAMPSATTSSRRVGYRLDR